MYTETSLERHLLSANSGKDEAVPVLTSSVFCLTMHPPIPIQHAARTLKCINTDRRKISKVIHTFPMWAECGQKWEVRQFDARHEQVASSSPPLKTENNESRECVVDSHLPSFFSMFPFLWVASQLWVAKSLLIKLERHVFNNFVHWVLCSPLWTLMYVRQSLDVVRTGLPL